MSTLTVENKIGSFKTKANRHWKEVACQADVRGEERVTSLRTSAWEANVESAYLYLKDYIAVFWIILTIDKITFKLKETWK